MNSADTCMFERISSLIRNRLVLCFIGHIFSVQRFEENSLVLEDNKSCIVQRGFILFMEISAIQEYCILCLHHFSHDFGHSIQRISIYVVVTMMFDYTVKKGPPYETVKKGFSIVKIFI